MSVAAIRSLFDRFNVWLTVELANICNLRCTMCDVRKYDPLIPSLMDRKLFTRVMDELVEQDIHIYGLKLFWLGEPLLHPEFSDILASIPARQVNETVVFDTNCQFLDEDVTEAIIERCRDCKVYIFLSLDAVSDDVYQRMRTGGDRVRAYENVHRLLRRRQEEGLEFPKVRIQFIVHPQNRHEATDFVSYWRSQPYFNELPIMDAIQDDRDFIHLRRWITGEEQPLADRLYDETLAELGIAREEMPANVDQRDCHTGDFVCENLFAMPMIRASGDVTVCNNDVELALKLGNLRDSSFLDIWCGEEANRLRRLHLEGCRGEICKCAHCASAQRTYFPEAMDEMTQILSGIPKGVCQHLGDRSERLSDDDTRPEGGCTPLSGGLSCCFGNPEGSALCSDDTDPMGRCPGGNAPSENSSLGHAAQCEKSRALPCDPPGAEPLDPTITEESMP